MCDGLTYAPNQIDLGSRGLSLFSESRSAAMMRTEVVLPKPAGCRACQADSGAPRYIKKRITANPERAHTQIRGKHRIERFVANFSYMCIHRHDFSTLVSFI
jgi:hypothetical protein